LRARLIYSLHCPQPKRSAYTFDTEDYQLAKLDRTRKTIL
jgi:hypothetical protein